MTDIEYEELIAHLRQQIEDLTAERDRLKAESTNASTALMVSNESNAALSETANDMYEALQMLGIDEQEETTNDIYGEGSEAQTGDA